MHLFFYKVPFSPGTTPEGVSCKVLIFSALNVKKFHSITGENVIQSGVLSLVLPFLLQTDGFGLGRSPSSNTAALGGDYRSHTAGTLRHDWDWYGAFQPSKGPPHPRYTWLTDCIRALHIPTNTLLYMEKKCIKENRSKLKWHPGQLFGFLRIINNNVNQAQKWS